MEVSCYGNLIKYLSSYSHGNNPFRNFKYPKNGYIPEENEIRCPICLKLAWKPVHPDTCNHAFCKRCILLWCKRKLTCPICRVSFINIYDIDLYDN